MKLGIHAYAWCSTWSNDTLDLIDKVKDLGLDFIELPLMREELFDEKAVRQRLNDVGLDACTSTVLTEKTDLTSSDAAVRQAGIDYLKRCVQLTEAIGAKRFSGVIYAQHVKPALRPPTKREWEYAASGLAAVAQFARQYGVDIGIEPVNRYETYLVNTAAQAKRLKEMIGASNVKVHLDTYHMNMEEKSFYEAVIHTGRDLMHIHLCENDRGIPGTGLVDWDGLFKALGEIEYDGFAALESFVDCTDNMNTWVWRALAKDGETLVKQGVFFIKEKMKQYGLL